MYINEVNFLSILIVLSIGFISIRASKNIDFTVEENNESTINKTRHLHRLRHSRERQLNPYLSASSTIINTRNSNHLESFSLNCPHVADANNKDVRIEVVWTLNETVWLKIENGQRKIVNGESSFNKRRVAGKTVLRVLLNNARYMFDYDELTGDFSMEISPVLISTDNGIWQCHVTVRQPTDETHTLTSRRRIKYNSNQFEISKIENTRSTNKKIFNPRPRIENIRPSSSNVPKIIENEKKPDFVSFHHSNIEKRGDRSSLTHQNTNFALFSRQNDDTVYMTRKSEETSSIVFDRNDPKMDLRNDAMVKESHRRMDTQIDYELDMNDEMAFSYPNFLNSRSRIRSANYYENSIQIKPLSYLFIFLSISLIFL